MSGGGPRENLRLRGALPVRMRTGWTRTLPVERKYCARAITNSCAGTSFTVRERSAWLLAIRAGNAQV